MKLLIFILLLFSGLMMGFSCLNGNEYKAQSVRNNVKKGYQLIWSDEFNYTGLPDSTKWSYDTAGNNWSWGNNEKQYYTSERRENVVADGQYLHIIAIKEKWNKKDFTSARLITKGKGDWLYGKVEVRAKLPGGKGIWPAIWMLPTDNTYGPWPNSGEIDIMEHVGFLPDSVFSTVHTEKYNHVKGTQKSKAIYLPDCEKQFHNYILEWNKDEFIFFIDSIKCFTFKNENTDSSAWPFNKRFHLLLNIAVGGNWGAAKGLDKKIFPQEMLVDYVRVFQ